MSWKFGGVYLKHAFDGDPERALRFLNIDKRFTYQTVRFSATVERLFDETAIGIVDGITLVQDNGLPYDNQYETDTFSPTDERMRDQSRHVELMAFFLDGITESYGLTHFRKGQRIRQYAVLNGKVVQSAGDFTSDAHHPEDRMLGWLDAFTGLSFNKLLLDDKPLMSVFSETGF